MLINYARIAPLAILGALITACTSLPPMPHATPTSNQQPTFATPSGPIISIEKTFEQTGKEPLFAHDSHDLDEGSIQTLKNFIYELGKQGAGNTEMRFVVNGYTDGTGERDYNQKLSELRANSVATFLVDLARESNWKPLPQVFPTGCGQTDAPPGVPDQNRRRVTIFAYNAPAVQKDPALTERAHKC